jgi:hypothetical protein
VAAGASFRQLLATLAFSRFIVKFSIHRKSPFLAMSYFRLAPIVVALPLIAELASAESPLVRGPLAATNSIVEMATRNAADSSKRTALTKVAPMLVKLTHVQTEPEYTRLAATLDSTSRTAIGGIPGITVLGELDDEVALAKSSRKPVVVLSATLQNLAASRQGDEVEFRAKVQYIIYRIPGRDVAAIVDGAARTRISAIRVKSKASRQQVEDDVASAAVESAARRAPAALLAISKK